VRQAEFEALAPPWLRTATLVAAVLTIPSVIFDVVVGLPGWLDLCAHVLNWSVWSVFLLAFLVVAARAPSPWAAIRANPFLPLIVVFTIPFAPAGLQMFRLLRLGALLGIAHRARRIFSIQGLHFAAIVLTIVVFGGGAIFTAVERSAQHLSIEQGVWWAIVTVTTVGYGDIVPHTEAGRAVAVVVMATGIGAAALVFGAAAQRFVAGGGDGGEAGAEQPAAADLQRELQGLRAEVAALRDEIRTGPRGA
jgi:voltage-gated potassium channel